MSDKTFRAIDPLGIVALANILKIQELQECSCELICVCENHASCSCELKCTAECSCEMKCLTVCSCELKPVQTDLLEMVSNPIFREVVKGLDIKRLKTIDDFLSIVDEIRTKINLSKLAPPSTDTKKP
jgi:hypothetical protein